MSFDRPGREEPPRGEQAAGDADRLPYPSGNPRPDHGTRAVEDANRELHHDTIHRHRIGQYVLAIVGTLAALAAMVLLALGTAGFVRTTQLAQETHKIVVDARAEQRQRIDQNCYLFETDHLDDVTQLRNTYRFLEAARSSVNTADNTTVLYQFIVAGLPELEKRAHKDNAPDYCDLPGAKAEARGAAVVGRPEPDPVVPDRPKSLRDLP
jgi:hypothetical protein